MTSGGEHTVLGEAANRFLVSLTPEERVTSQQEIYRFVRWFGQEHALSALTPSEVAHYAEQLSLSDTDYQKRLDLIRAFLLYARKEKWTRANLATHLKTKKDRAKTVTAPRTASPETAPLTGQGRAQLEAELATLKTKRLEIIEEIRRAAADKDFRENVPLQAAREQRGHLEGQILELEKTLKSAAIIGEKEKDDLLIGAGNTVILHNLDSGEDLVYTLVSPREVDASRGRISAASPIGRAIVGKSRGETVEVSAPGGKLRYQVREIRR